MAKTKSTKNDLQNNYTENQRSSNTNPTENGEWNRVLRKNFTLFVFQSFFLIFSYCYLDGLKG
jgi:hypothetical protein